MTNMKNLKKTLIFTALSAMTVTGLVACGGGGSTPAPKPNFEFDISLASGSNNLLYVEPNDDGEYVKGVKDTIKITERNADPESTYTYSITLSAEGIASDKISDYVTTTFDAETKGFTVIPQKETGTYFNEDEQKTMDCTITAAIREASVKKPKRLTFKIVKSVDAASAGYNFAADDDARAEILGKLEKYAMENYLTGITLFENGGYVRYSDRVTVPATEYITGYGWGILADGSLTGTLPGATVKPEYLQQATGNDPLTINAWDATGSQVSDLNSYITSSYWGTRLKGTTDYEWYPVLAKDTVKINGVTVPNNRPIHVEEDNPTNLYKKWRIYVKTGAEEGIQYRTNSTAKAAYNERDVALEDYEFVYQLLLSERSQLTRGSELAGDTSYGIKGAQAYYRKSKNITDNAKLDKLWSDMKTEGELGIKTGVDPVNGSYIEIELINPIDDFTAMYTLSSNLYSPMPKEFMQSIVASHDYTEAATLYGTFPSKESNILDNTLCVGPFLLEQWDKDQQTIFMRNDDWFEVGARYHIPGVRIQVIDMSDNANAVWQHFDNGELDSAGIPKDVLEDLDLTKERKSGGDATFKLNVNSCTQEEWNKLFGDNGTIKQQKDNDYIVKPWMSNKNFLKGLYWSINRKAFAQARGVNPSFSYFADSYMSDPQNGESYNTTPEHIAAVSKFHDIYDDPITGETVDNMGYNLDTAKNAFKTAISELEEQGALTDIKDGILTKDQSTGRLQLHIHIRWMYQTDIRDYGEEIGGYFERAFNAAAEVIAPGKYELIVDQDAVTVWNKVYDEYLMVGKFDLGFGAISGNSYNPLNFLEVLKSDNSSGFTLNWGTDTSVIDEVNPIIYEGKAWSFDALWAAADHGTVVTEGRDKGVVENCYMQNYSTNTLYSGGTFEIPFNFYPDIDLNTVEFNITEVRIYLVGYGTVAFDVQLVNGKYTITITQEQGELFNQYIVDNNDLEKKAKDAKTEEEAFELRHPFTADKYNIWWNMEIKYTISINGGQPTENTAYVYASVTEQQKDKK